MEMLAEEAKALKGQLDSINKRITELEKSEKKIENKISQFIVGVSLFSLLR